MADGHLVASMGVWTGNITIGSAKCESSFEVFDSGGAWALLVGKPLLEQLKATSNSTQTLWGICYPPRGKYLI